MEKWCGRVDVFIPFCSHILVCFLLPSRVGFLSLRSLAFLTDLRSHQEKLRRNKNLDSTAGTLWIFPLGYRYGVASALDSAVAEGDFVDAECTSSTQNLGGQSSA